MDAVRQDILESGGYTIKRVTSAEVREQLESVLRGIMQVRQPSPLSQWEREAVLEEARRACFNHIYLVISFTNSPDFI